MGETGTQTIKMTLSISPSTPSLMVNILQDHYPVIRNQLGKYMSMHSKVNKQ